MEWQDPPPPLNPYKNPENERFARELKKRPNKWALLCEYESQAAAGSYAYHLRNGMTPGFKKGVFEAVSRSVETNYGMAYRVFIRYVGEHRLKRAG